MSLRGPSFERGTIFHILLEKMPSSYEKRIKVTLVGSSNFIDAPRTVYNLLREAGHTIEEGSFSRRTVVHREQQDLSSATFVVRSKNDVRKQILELILKEIFGVEGPIKEGIKGMKIIQHPSGKTRLEVYTDRVPLSSDFPKIPHKTTAFNMKRVIYVFNSVEEALRHLPYILRKEVKW